MALKRSYRYVARDQNGIAMTGQVEAVDERAVSRSLRELNYVIVSIEQIKASRFNIIQQLQLRFVRISKNDVLLFMRQMAAMVNAGLPLLSSLSDVVDQTESVHFRRVLINVASDIRGGKSLSEALSAHPRLFSQFYINMIRAGEAGGMLGDVLNRIASIGYEEQELKGRIGSAFAYPILLIVLSTGIITALLTIVLPKFIGIFQQSGTKLPIPTQILLLVSGGLRKFWYVPLSAALVLGILAYLRFKTSKGRYFLHKRVLSIPVMGKMIRMVAISRFCKIMGALTKSGVPLLGALGVSEALLGNAVLSNAVSHVRQAVTGGASLSESLKVSGVFTPMMIQMLSVGERTGKLDEMFFQVGDFYDRESVLAIRTITTLLEPLLLLFMGLIIGFIAVSVLLPIFNLVKVLKH